MIRSDIRSVSHPPNPVKIASTSSAFQIIQRVKAVQTDSTLKPTERIMLAHLMFAAGQSGETSWKHESLAAAIGISRCQSIRITSKLDIAGRIRSQQRGLRRANRYLMPWHPEFSEVAPMQLQESPEVAPATLPEVASMQLPEVASTLLPIEKEALEKEKPLKLASRGVIPFEQQPHLQALKVELQALREAVPGFVADTRLNHQTVKNIWEAAIANCPELEVNDLALWLRREAHGSRQFVGWGGVVSMIRQELEYDPADSGNYEPDYARDQRQQSEPEFTEEDFKQHLNYCASELMKLESPTFRYDEVVRFALSDCDYAEYYLENLGEAEERMWYLEDKTMRRAMAALSIEQQHEINSEIASRTAPYAYQMTCNQRNLLADQCARKLIFERLGLPRFSLWYMDKSKMAPHVEKPYRDVANLNEDKLADVLLEEEVDSLPIGPAFEQGFIDESAMDELQDKYSRELFRSSDLRMMGMIAAMPSTYGPARLTA